MPISTAELKQLLLRLLVLPLCAMIWLADHADAFEMAIGNERGPTYSLGIGISSLIKMHLLPTTDIDLDPVITGDNGESLEALSTGLVAFGLVAVDEETSLDGPDLRAIATLGKVDGRAKTLMVRNDVDDTSVHHILETIFNGIDFLKAIDPQLQHLTPDSAVMGLALPLHGGAKRFYADWWSSPERGTRTAAVAPASEPATNAAPTEPQSPAAGGSSERNRAGPAAPADARSYVLYFDFDDASLTNSAETKLREAADFAATLRSPAIIVAAYTDSVGGAEYNYLLAERRAGTVMAQLEDLSVRYSSMDLSLFGERSPWAVTLDEVKESENRRVELFIEEPVPEVEPLPLPAGTGGAPTAAGKASSVPKPAGGPRQRVEPTAPSKTM